MASHVNVGRFDGVEQLSFDNLTRFVDLNVLDIDVNHRLRAVAPAYMAGINGSENERQISQQSPLNFVDFSNHVVLDDGFAESVVGVPKLYQGRVKEVAGGVFAVCLLFRGMVNLVCLLRIQAFQRSVRSSRCHQLGT
ncbi:YidC/Oxa1 family membrane protein insertase [Babesia caballi]|uniref:YidC/Oxa1 family membrane protein insertase n=1 Tax=Babesia caballi TaxID=5871 RepID=A0AAV4LXT5_BABCB|nr:YidC/Oxa1 family membrane protein insertase [Babesia caballi]